MFSIILVFVCAGKSLIVKGKGKLEFVVFWVVAFCSVVVGC
jgi:hypothetical protein